MKDIAVYLVCIKMLTDSESIFKVIFQSSTTTGKCLMIFVRAARIYLKGMKYLMFVG